MRAYGSLKLFRLITYDAGAFCSANARAVVSEGLDYLFALKREQRWLHRTVSSMFQGKSITGAAASSEDKLSSRKNVKRFLFIADLHLDAGMKTAVRVTSSTYVDGLPITVETRYFVSSLEQGQLSPKQWLLLVRRHWGVETCHSILDTAFQEDDHTWVRKNAAAVFVLIVLRRVAYNLLTLFRAAGREGSERVAATWKELMRHLEFATRELSENEVETLRGRPESPVTS